MEYYINEECINCGACMIECPQNAVSEPIKNLIGYNLISKTVSSIHYFIVSQLCDKCISFSSPKCIEVCPMDAIQSNDFKIEYFRSN